MGEITEAQRQDLQFVVGHGGISVYSPSQRSIDRYGPLQDLGYLTIKFVDVDGQETKLRIVPTDAGRTALKAGDAS